MCIGWYKDPGSHLYILSRFWPATAVSVYVPVLYLWLPVQVSDCIKDGFHPPWVCRYLRSFQDLLKLMCMYLWCATESFFWMHRLCMGCMN